MSNIVASCMEAMKYRDENKKNAPYYKIQLLFYFWQYKIIYEYNLKKI